MSSQCRAHTDALSINEHQPSVALSHIPAPEVDASEFDEGWQACSQVVPTFVAFSMTWGYGTAFAAYQLYYQETLQVPSSEVSWIESTQLFLYFMVGLVSGRVADAGYTRWLYLAGSVMSTIGMFMASLATEYSQVLLAQGFCVGIGGGSMFLTAVVNLTKYFYHNRMFAMSASACGPSIGAIIFAATAHYLTPRIGLPWPARICACMTLFISVLGNFS